MEKRKILKRCGALFSVLVVLACAVCFVPSFSKPASAVDLTCYPTLIPNNFVVAQVKFDSSDYSDPLYFVLPLSGDDIVDSNNSWNLRDATGSILGVYNISYDGGMLVYSFNWRTPVTTVSFEFNSLLFFNSGDSMTFFKFKGDQPISGHFYADTFHINRNIVDGTLIQEVVDEPLRATYSQLDSDTWASANLRSSSYDVFVEYYYAYFDAPGESYSSFSLAVPSRYFDPLEVGDLLTDTLDFHQDLSENITVTEFPTDWTSWLVTAVGGFLDAELLPGFTLGGIAAALLGILLLWMFIHVFK